MSINPVFIPVQAKESKIKNLDLMPGYLYFATDTGKMYLDTIDDRINVGGAGASIYYNNGEAIEKEEYWLIDRNTLLNSNDSPTIKDILLNENDGCFYKIENIDINYFICTRISVSGNGEITGPTKSLPSLFLSKELEKQPDSNIINGSDWIVYFTATSAKGTDGYPLAEDLTITWKLLDGDTVYQSSTFSVKSGVESYFNFGPHLRHSTTTTLQLIASGINHDEPSAIREMVVASTELTLTLDPDFSNTSPFEPDEVIFSVTASGKIDKKMEIRFDGELIPSLSKTLGPNQEWDGDIAIPRELCSHGYHSVRIDLYPIINRVQGKAISPIKFEIAVIEEGKDTPIVWLGNYSNTYYTYDSIQIPYLAYDPANPSEAQIYLYKNYVHYLDDIRTVTSRSRFQIWEISDADNEATNHYQIACGNTNDKRKASEREITFQVLQDIRDLTVAAQNNLRLNFDPKGRSNSESKTRRSKWSYQSGDKTINAIFEKFNWSNNGWSMDSKNNTFLRISNGAKFSIPMGVTQFSEQSHTFEIMFKIRNVQNYEGLVKNVTRYYLDKDKKETDDVLYEEFKNQTDFDNYDAYLQYKLGPAYDNLEFKEVQKILNINNAVCKYCDGSGQNVLGWALGAQDAFFRDGQKAISVSYVDEDLVSLSIVYKYDPSGKNMILFYLNGVITGADYTSATAFNIGEKNPYIEFNTDFCDIDLYKLRVYNTNLDVNEIVRNFCVDRKDINNFDLISLAKKNSNTSEYQIQFDKVEAWNKEHPNNQTMPYIIFDTTKTTNSNKRLPWSKATSMATTITFVNTQLDQAYANGELEELSGPDGDKLWDRNSTPEEKIEAIKLYYKHHCPSWTGNNCELVVQGTSSEYYPRRNYKIKTKTDYDADEQERVHIFLNRGPFAEDYKKNPENTRQAYWYMNNYTNGTHKWTMKVDYMESSGSYNAGFASMVGNSYSKHPLKDYLDSGAISSTVTEYKKDDNGKDTTEVIGYHNGLIPQVTFTEQLSSDILSNANIRWQDYRTSLLGFPVMAFHKRAEKDYVFIGYYRMLLDKGSDEVLGFKPEKGVKAKFLGNKDVRKKAECWEFSNNNRTYCSYRDPEDRNVLSFMPSESEIANGKGLTAAGVPIVADCFEYRYNDNEDYLDILYNLGKKEGNKWSFAGSEEDAKTFEEETHIDLTSTANWPAAREKMIDYYKNWERACQWIWSTCLDNVVSMGSYVIAPVGNVPFTTNGNLYKENLENGGFQPVTSGNFEENIIYFINDGTTETGEIKWVRVYVYDPSGDAKYKYVGNKFYQNVDGVYSLVSDEEFNSDITYYELIIDESYKTKSDLLVTKATTWDTEGKTQYYTWDKSVTTAAIRGGNPSVQPVITPTKEEFDAGKYYVAAPVTYGSGAGAKTYYYDTQEYRAEKFVKELSSHFDLEYLATYFIMTEVFECYDSRGKNCMMASWGPLKEGGDYIWYPIFYDIDTQLGINNTGIPSFTFNVDVTLQDNFSTSDSILWNNFYSFFRGSYILAKYKHLKNEDNLIFTRKLSAPPLTSVHDIESWYLFDPEVTNNIAARGLRPLIATNLDSWYKYITTTNIIGSVNEELMGDVGYLGRNGEWLIDTDGKFYMLQGDRSQSRQSFLTKRLDYIDSWLGVGGYQRSGSNCIWGRVSANDFTDTSDKWMEGNPANEQYWTDTSKTQKTHEFDAEYWLNLTPLYSTYITVSDDSAAYPPVKYDGITPAHIESSAIESGVRKSKNYREQLLYIYGSDKMLDIGDMSNLYWREFRIDGKASKLTRLKLGHDDTSYDYIYNDSGEKVYSEMPWKNGYLNKPNFPSGLGSTGMPLLKEVNLCNITIQSGESDPTFDFSTCEKLQNFRATGSNITQVTFADGVALDTLYLPTTIRSLSLKEANLLTSVLKTYTKPIKNIATNKLEAIPGLYLESFFDGTTSNLNQLNLIGGSLGYDSFELFNRFYELRKGQTGNRLTMTDINWCPFVQLVDGDVYNESLNYYYDNGHYGFEEYEYINDTQFQSAIIRGELYYKDNNLINKSEKLDLNIYNIIKSLITDNNFKSYEDPKVHINLSGLIYIDNTDENQIDEYELADVVTKAYPQLKIFAANVKTAYSAQFVVLKDNGAYDYVPDINGDTTFKSIQKISQKQYNNDNIKIFDNPFNLYDASNSKTHYDFIGWTTSLEPDLVKFSNVLLKNESEYWGVFNPEDPKYNYKGIKWGVINPEEINQIYYAVFTCTTYTATFVDKENPNYNQTVSVQYSPSGSYFHDNILEPININPVDNVEERWALRGWTTTENYGGSYAAGIDVNEYLVNVSKCLAINNTTIFYAVFQKESVYDSITDHKYFDYNYDKNNNLTINLKPEYGDNLTGKITLPAKDPNGNDIISVGLILNYNNNGTNTEIGRNITHIFFEKNNKYKYINDNAFYNPTGNSWHYNLQGIYLPDNIISIGYGSFQNIFYPMELKLPDTIQVIGPRAFRSGGNGFNKVIINKLPASLTTIGEDAFYKTEGVTINSLPKGVKVLPANCFANSKNVRIDTFGSTEGDSLLTTIGERCFYKAGSGNPIETIYLHRSVIELAEECFLEYGNLSQIYTALPENDPNRQSWDIGEICGPNSKVTINTLENM